MASKNKYLSKFAKFSLLEESLCPICDYRYFDVEDSEYVCDIHQEWLVTQCKTCGHFCFSTFPGYCPHHFIRPRKIKTS